MRTHESRVAGLGSARDGVGHWWAQRVTAIALIPLAVLFLPPFAEVAGGDLTAATELYANPYHAIVAILFVATCLYHLFLGMRVVVEDYVHHGGWKTALLLANTLGCVLLGAIGTFSIASIAFSS